MKKNLTLLSLLVAGLATQNISLQAMEEDVEEVAEVVEQPEAKPGWAKRQFNESLKRFKNCMKGSCSRGDALRAARDLGIAAVAVIGASYVLGRGAGYSGGYMKGKASAMTSPINSDSLNKSALLLESVGSQFQNVGGSMQVPAEKIYEAGQATVGKAQELYGRTKTAGQDAYNKAKGYFSKP